MRAPLAMPVELRRAPTDRERWFVLAITVAPDRLELSAPASDDLDDRVYLTFHLPGDDRPITGGGRLIEVRPVGEGNAERRAIALDISPEDRERILDYVNPPDYVMVRPDHE